MNRLIFQFLILNKFDIKNTFGGEYRNSLNIMSSTIQSLTKELTTIIRASGQCQTREIKLYVQELLGIIYHLWRMQDFTWDKFNDTSTVINYIKNVNVSIETRKNMMQAVKIYVTSCGLPFSDETKSKYVPFCDNVSIPVNNAQQTPINNKITAKLITESKYKKDWDIILAKAKEHEKTKDINIDHYFKYYLAKLYTLHPPLGLLEWAACIFLDKDDGFTSHVNIKEGYMKLYSSKPRKFWLSPSLINVMEQFRVYIREERDVSGLEWVIPNYRYGYGPNQSSNLCDLLKKTFGGISMTAIKKAYKDAVSELDKIHRIYVEVIVMGLTPPKDMLSEEIQENLKKLEQREEVERTLGTLDKYMHGCKPKINTPKKEQNKKIEKVI